VQNTGGVTERRAEDLVRGTGSDVAHALFWGLLAAALVVAGIVAGSRGLKDFDVALVPYAGATVFAAFGVGYRYSMWLRRPSTRLYWFRGIELFFAPAHLPGNAFRLFRQLVVDVAAQRFILHRARSRWAAHQLIFWGCILAAAVTFPLSFGWIRFETLPDTQDAYQAFVFGIPVLRFPLGGALAPLVFQVLDVSAVLVLAGLGIAMWRRGRDRGALAVQQLAPDLVPVVILFAICTTGLLLTISTHWLRGFHYVFLAQFHAVTVIFGLVYLPFGKFFHIFQRPAQLGIGVYKRTGAEGPQAACRRCGQPFASALHVRDLEAVEAALAIRFATAAGHYQEICPPCRRRMVGIAQDQLWRDAGRARPEGT
jgi:hypothetical protein